MHRLRGLLVSLRTFDAVCRSGGVTRAADVLHLTPGAVSQQLKQLESTAGIVLFQRTGREMELTATGKALADSIADAFDAIEKALAEATLLQAAKRLRLKLSPSLAIRWLMPRLPGFYALHADVELQIATLSRGDDLRLDGADCAIRLGMGEWTDVDFDHLFDDAFVAVCAPDLAPRFPNARAMLGANPLHSMLRPEAWSLWLASAGVSELPHSTGITMANAALCCQAAANGLGIAVVQRAFVQEDLAGGRLVMPVDHVATTEMGYYLVCDRARAASPEVRAFREWVRSLH